MKKILLLSAILASLASCQKEFAPEDNPINPSDSTLVTDSCHITRAYYYGGSGGINDSADFIYNNLKLTKVQSMWADVMYTYDSNRIVALRYYETPANRLYLHDSIIYSNNKVIKMLVHDYDMYNAMDTIHSILDFTYTGARLSSIRRQDWWEGYPDEIDTSFWHFVYTNDNVSKLTLHDADNVQVDSIFYSYNNALNYFGNVSAYFYLADPFFQLHVGFEPHLPYFLSKNNVTGFLVSGIDYQVSYSTDSSGRPLSVDLDGFDYMKYKYNCP